ncbi:DUF1559 domain-containing protein [bacterium]|nr:MAG: DUF1559 domain-containing protein [bacterium]
MNRRRAFTWLEFRWQLAIFLILTALLIPKFMGARENARRANCQSNLKQIGLALQQYVTDNGGDLPSRHWPALLKPYIKEDRVFRCSTTSGPKGASDYFFHARFLEKPLKGSASPPTLILLGDGNDGLPLARFPDSWRTDENSPAWRHIEGANYCFADGHVKWLKSKRVTDDFRMVIP